MLADGTKPIAQGVKSGKRVPLAPLKSSPFTAYTNLNAPIITSVKHSQVLLEAEFEKATPDSLAVPSEFTIDEYTMELPEEQGEDEDEKISAAKELDPRSYQLELLDKALKENIIAVLDTGSGKTLIAVMLIKAMDEIEKEHRETRRKTKIAVFLVDRVPLVFQQKDVIAANCDLSVKHLCGEMVWDQWNEKLWETVLKEDDVCVMTAQILLDALRHGFIHLDNIHLMIFDECHHATKQHTFNMIMREFYDRCPDEEKPKIFGMTASPMNSKSEVHYTASRLEENMRSKIFTAQNLTSLKGFVNRPAEVVVEYSAYVEKEFQGLLKQLMEGYGTDPRFKEMLGAASWVYHQLGPWCSDILCKRWFERISVFSDMSSSTLFESDAIDIESEKLSSHAKEIQEYVLPQPDITNTKLFSHKIQRLVQILQLYNKHAPDFCGIIFVQRKYTAYILQWIIQSQSTLSELKTGVLTGHHIDGAGEARMRFKDQNRMISAFRKREINLLIATSVAEEGLDIQPCNLVIRFDFFSTLISYIQSRGRARRVDSRFIILKQKGNLREETLLGQLRMAEEEVRQWCRMLPEDRKASSIMNDTDDPFLDPYDNAWDDVDDVDDMFFIPSTQACITRDSAVGLLHRYCSLLPGDSYCTLSPTFAYNQDIDGYICTVTLPSNAAVQEEFSEFARSKLLAKRMVALKACIALYHAKGLDSHLRPIIVTPTMLGDMVAAVDRNGNVIGSRKRRKIYKKKTPWFWEKYQPDTAHEENFDDEEEDPNLVLSSQGHWLSLDDSKPSDIKAITENRLPQPQENGVVVNDSIPNANEAALNNTDACDSITLTMSKLHMKDVDSNTTNNTQTIPADIGDKTVSEDDEKIYPDTFKLYMTHLKLDFNPSSNGKHLYRDLCIFTHKPFPSIPTIRLHIREHETDTNIHLEQIGDEHTYDLKTVQSLYTYTLELMSAITNQEFKCDLDDMAFFLVPLKAILGSKPSADAIDWDEIYRLVNDSAPESLDLNNLEHYLDSIVIDLSDNARRYYVNNVRSDMAPTSSITEDHEGREAGHESYSNYYIKVLNRTPTVVDQPLLEVERVTKTQNHLSKHVFVTAKPPKRAAKLVLPEFCALYRLSASVFRMAMLLPSIMMRLDSFLLVKEVQQILDTPIEDNLLLEAFTTPSASMDMDYERLETLGDSFLKFVTTIRLYIMFPVSHEGQLHCQRIRIICNKALYRSARRLQIYRHITSQPFNRRRWRPPHFKKDTDEEEVIRMQLRRHELSDKTLADVVEATLGAAYMTGGVELGLRAAIALQVPFDHITEWKHFNETYVESRANVPSRAKMHALRHVKLDHLEEITGYRFQNALLAVEALTHASLPNSTVPCYQRLEFLGDGILDFLVVKYLFHKYPGFEPGQMTDLKDACVNNHILGALCLEMGLNKRIIHFNSKLIGAITQFAREVEIIKENGEHAGEYWSDLEIPKVLSDVVESVLGAIFVDAGFDFQVVENAFNYFMRPFIDEHVKPETLKVHPLKTLTTGLQKIGCDGLLIRNHCTKREDKMSQKCVIFLHAKPIASAASHNIREARKQAAIHAIAYLEDNLSIIPHLCDCNITLLDHDLNEGAEDEDKDIEE
ncbi:hypothetical protein INT43_009080 [Umbelopsis isabellina]|uniref:Dicer-like protein 1 n=1 Tax=Mortierella isabellina TaxID=91625 RepID=A0A8H7PCL7_MORIS|nr:hypothetical protein INT43_009080 [Umbelopsis isabellina]